MSSFGITVILNPSVVVTSANSSVNARSEKNLSVMRPEPRGKGHELRQLTAAEISRCWRLYQPTRVTYGLRPSRPATPGLSQGLRPPGAPSTDIAGPRRSAPAGPDPDR